MKNYTPAQTRIKARIENGEKVQHLNKHYSNGGSLFWMRGDTLRIRPFWATLEKMAREQGAKSWNEINKVATQMYGEIVEKNNQ